MPNAAPDDDTPPAPDEAASADDRRRATLLDTSDNVLAKCIAPAMPWLFLALRRALIPTACLLVLVVLFFAVPQTREVLLGLTEPVSQHVSGDASASSLNVAPLTWYIVFSVLLSLSVWYSARLLCTVEAWLGMPLIWEIRDLGPHWPSDRAHDDPRKHTNEVRVKTAIQRMPRAYAVGALALCMGSLVHASLFSVPILLVALLLAGPLIVACGVLDIHAGRPGGRARKISTVAVGGVIYIVSGIVLPRYFKSDAHQSMTAVIALDMLCALLPALVLIVLVMRRPWMKRIYKTWFRRTDKMFPYEVFESHHALRFEDVFWQVLLFVAIGTALLLMLANLHAKYLRSIGSVGTIMLFLAAAVVAISGYQLFLRRISRAVPGFTSSVAIVAVLMLQFFSHERLGHETIGKQQSASNPNDQAMPAPHYDPGGHYLLVNAYGGGLRAAIFTAQMLALADDASCGEFGKHIYAMSGVSGGSLGIAVYLIARQTLAPTQIWRDCTDRPIPSPVATPLTDVVTKALVQDHLSPVIATALSIDVFLRTPLTPRARARRGQAMLDSWNDALVAALEPHDISSNVQDWDFPLGLPITQLTGDLSPAPRVYFNTTDADTGEGKWFSNGADGEALSNFDVRSPEPPVTVGQAVLHSARFPYATPAGAYDDGLKSRRLVDGGYADNSGTRTLHARLPSGQHENTPNLNDLATLDINGNPREPDADKTAPNCAKVAVDTQTSIPTALLALLQTRAARAEEAVRELTSALHECGKDKSPDKACIQAFQIGPEPDHATHRRSNAACDKTENAREIPLGWYTGPGASQLVAQSAKAQVQAVCLRAHVKCHALR